MNTIEKVFCPSCGAPVVFEDGSEEVFCSHCGTRLHRDDDNIVRKMEHTEVMAEYADRHEAREHEKEYNQEQWKIAMKSLIILAIMCVFFKILLMF